MTEYLYDRDNPKSHFRQRLTGIEGLFFGVPNINERADMIGRALAKETDGDFGKFVNTTKKPRDNAQRWRAFKNIARFTKNPLGYMYWKIQPFHAQNRIRLTWVFLVFHLYQSFLLYVMIKNQKEKMIQHWRYRIGENNQSHDGPHRDRRMPANRHKNYLRYSNFHQVRRNKRLGMIHTNWWCRDQNFRKYFEMRKRHGIRPALSGFYHEELYEQTAKKNAQIAAMRASRDYAAN
mmetsp:Transcript_2107/g.1432  ORF Transcript_2107/g.1432 Transcript_2107/m.1432 type:complete len:235 (+) Transcript_2107:37-741(+)|eukprot:CAMPEP_0116875160 /NCGR_PEP_ID=MMETSP0463-20121206/6944_1 /TAXON_ID=181622 /ORGANISM="Strombidinopsis sp, Strain SopsisLIS2011" /LENGTH=234 /DNA_ID=CAMNT_0004520171 /DNA_START=24 /DNA_END=728 /DNA_ORIENTATION=+